MHACIEVDMKLTLPWKTLACELDLEYGVALPFLHAITTKTPS
jgi:hypothetical protein